MTVTVTRTTVPEHGIVRYASIGGLELEGGGYLPDVTLAYETWGTLNEDGSNAVLIEHRPVLRGVHQHCGRVLRVHGSVVACP
jgi:homoserine acetyltransferase